VQQQIGREYEQWLITFRGLATETISHRFGEAGRFLEWLGERINSTRIAELTGNTIDAYLTFRAPPLARRSLKLMACDLRCFLRYLYSTGRTALDLAPFVIAPKLYAFESLPSALRAEEVRAVIERARHDQSATRSRYCLDASTAVSPGSFGGPVPGLASDRRITRQQPVGAITARVRAN